MKTYKSKIGLEFLIPIIILFGSAFIHCIISEQWGLIIPVFFIPSIIIYLILFKVEYIINENKLNIAFHSLVNTTIDINTITKISETYNPMGAPASSIDRLEIMYNKNDTVLVSPKDKKGFIDSLLAINPNIEVVYRKNSKKIAVS